MQIRGVRERVEEVKVRAVESKQSNRGVGGGERDRDSRPGEHDAERLAAALAFGGAGVALVDAIVPHW